MVDSLEEMRRKGYARFELFMNRPHLDYRNLRLMKSIARWFQENGLPSPSIHLPFFERVGPTGKRWISVLESERRLRESAIDELKRALEFSEWIPVRYGVLHLGNPGEPFNFVQFDHAFSALDAIRRFSGVRVAVENIPNEFSTVDRINEWIDAAKVQQVGICYDTGHGHIQGRSERFERIEATHIHDNDGQRDQHLWPFEGKLDWPALIDRLATAGYAGDFLFETRVREDAGIERGDELRDRIGQMWEERIASAEDFRSRHGLEGAA